MSSADMRKKDDSKEKNKKLAIIAAALVVVFVLWRGNGVYTPSRPRPAGKAGPTLKLATWNIAAINNNPFEYWITHNDQAYNKLMLDVQDFIDNPGDRDVLVSDVFTEKMFSDLLVSMNEVGWEGTTETADLWNSDFKKRRIVSQFMKDKTLGDKRMASMPDRVSNTILTPSGPVYRPAVINCYQKPFKDINDWWQQWSNFIFKSSVEVTNKQGNLEYQKIKDKLKKIPRAKYPAVTEEEERISIPLQTMCGAIFDAILFHIVETVSGTKWQSLRTEMCEALNLKKTDHTLGVLERTYGDSDVIFLQEVAKEFIAKAQSDSLLSDYAIIAPAELGSRDQNSVVFLSKALFDITSVVEISKTVEANCNTKGLAPGDIIAITVNDRLGNMFMFASFHGDTNGLQTIPVVTAIHKTHSELRQNNVKLLMGLDANTYENSVPGKTQDVLEFAKAYVALGLTSIWGDHPDPTNHTTYNARTYLQPQLNKAAKKSELVSKGDVNPKDFVLYYNGDFTTKTLTKDNTGKKKYVEGMVFPTLQFPSDHGVLSAVVHKEF